MKAKTTIFIFQLISLIAFSQQEKIEEKLCRIIKNNKVGFVKCWSTDTIVSFDYELEPYGKRNIARYVEIDTLEGFSYANNKIREKIIGLDSNNYFEHFINNLPYDRAKDTLYQQNPIPFDYKGSTSDFLYGGEGFYAVYKNGKYGFINTTVKLIIPLQYESADDFQFIGETARYDKKEVIM